MQTRPRSLTIRTSGADYTTPAPARAEPVPLHPAVAAIPVAIFVSALGADAVAWWTRELFWMEAALRLTGAGAIIATLLVFSTLVDTGPFAQAIRDTLKKHLNQFYVPALAGLSLLLRLLGGNVDAVIPWGFVFSAVIVILLVIED